MFNVKAIIFDMDGVMIDSEYAYTAAIQEVIQDLGHEISEEYIYSFVGTTHDFTWTQIIKDFQLTDERQKLINEMFKYREAIVARDGLITYPHVREFILEAFEKGYLLAVASSSPKQEILRTVNHLAVEDYFKQLVSGEEVEHSKPAPDVFLLAAELLGVDPADCLVVEDSRNGSLAAKAAGMYCVGYRDVNHPNQDLTATDQIVHDFRDIALSPVKGED